MSEIASQKRQMGSVHILGFPSTFQIVGCQMSIIRLGWHKLHFNFDSKERETFYYSDSVKRSSCAFGDPNSRLH